VHGASIFAQDIRALRKSVGMVFQRPNPFPLSIIENVAFGLRVHGNASQIAAAVESSLESVGLWDALKDRLHVNALTLSASSNSVCASRACWR